jgi:transcriptional regulator with XRE-family HTH domain
MTDEHAETATMARDAIAAEVRAELARQGKTQREVGEIINLPQASVFMRLKGRRPFRGEELVLLAAWLKVPVERFMRSPDPVDFDLSEDIA